MVLAGFGDDSPDGGFVLGLGFSLRLDSLNNQRRRQ